MFPPSRLPDDPGYPSSMKYYFAFGSNMHLKQMATRCPESTLYSRGVLRGYRWQINNRGVANVVASKPEDFVEGIVFSVSPKDIRTLDRNEGVSKKLYTRELLPIEIRPLAIAALKNLKTELATQYLAQYGHERGPPKNRTPTPSVVPGPQPTKDHLIENDRSRHPYSSEQPNQVQGYRQPLTGNQQSDSQCCHRDDHPVARHYEEPSSVMTHTQDTKEYGLDPMQAIKEEIIEHALVYLSDRYNKDGDIRREYVQRMESAITDATKLGVSVDYLNNSLYIPYILGGKQQQLTDSDLGEISSQKQRALDGNDNNDSAISRKRPQHKPVPKKPEEFAPELDRRSGHRPRDARGYGNNSKSTDPRIYRDQDRAASRGRVSDGRRAIRDDGEETRSSNDETQVTESRGDGTDLISDNQ